MVDELSGEVIICGFSELIVCEAWEGLMLFDDVL